MPENAFEEVHILCRRLVKACGEKGLVAEQLSSTRVHAGVTNAGMLAEVIRCMPDKGEVLHWWWSWGEPICPAEDIEKAAKMIAYVVTPQNA